MNWHPMPGIRPARRRPGRGAVLAIAAACLVVLALALVAVGVVDVAGLDLPWGA